MGGIDEGSRLYKPDHAKNAVLYTENPIPPIATRRTCIMVTVSDPYEAMADTHLCHEAAFTLLRFFALMLVKMFIENNTYDKAYGAFGIAGTEFSPEYPRTIQRHPPHETALRALGTKGKLMNLAVETGRGVTWPGKRERLRVTQKSACATHSLAAYTNQAIQIEKTSNHAPY